MLYGERLYISCLININASIEFFFKLFYQLSIVFFQIRGPCKCSSVVSVFVRLSHFGISKKASVSFGFCGTLAFSAFPVAMSMANSTTTVMKVMTPGPAGRSSPEGSQVSPQTCM